MDHISMMGWADRVALESICTERQVGAAVLFSDGKRLAVANDCEYDSTNRHHAEARLIRWTFGLDGDRGQFKGATLYTTCRPCVRCTAMLLPLGLKAIYYRDPQPEMDHLQALRDIGVHVDGGWIKARQPIPLEAVQQSWAERWPKKLDQSVFVGAPAWAKWAARDRDGQIHLYDIKPCLLPNGWCDDVGGQQSHYVGLGEKGGDWENDLIERVTA